MRVYVSSSVRGQPRLVSGGDSLHDTCGMCKYTGSRSKGRVVLVAVKPTARPRYSRALGTSHDTMGAHAEREGAGMEQLKVIATEDETLILATESGERYALPIDAALRAQLRRARDRADDTSARKASPREIQAHIRAGLSAAEVAELLGVREEDVARYEGPV